MSYVPIVDDYVKWRNIEGWVYYVGDEYITIEVAVKDKPGVTFIGRFIVMLSVLVGIGMN